MQYILLNAVYGVNLYISWVSYVLRFLSSYG